MSDLLDGIRVLVADDQREVARTLCQPLQRAGAYVRYVTNGQTAFHEVEAEPYDLVVVDMKMPPDEWGGLWLLKELQTAEFRLPSLVLSGEGSKQQVIEALRYGAVDWVDKDKAGSELFDRCADIVKERYAESLEFSAANLPTPLANRLSRYSRTTHPAIKVSEGLHALEAVFRFAAIIGLSTMPSRPLRGITASRLMAPSMGTWFDICTALANASDASNQVTRFWSCLASERANHQMLQRFISIRNDLAHGRGEPDSEQARQLDAVLRKFAHRATCYWRGDLAVPASMAYDGSKFIIDALSFKSVGKPVPMSISNNAPVVTGDVYLFSPGVPPVSLTPWIVARLGHGGSSDRCLWFDGLQRSRGGDPSNVPFKYGQADGGVDAQSPVSPAATWQAVARWGS